MKKQPVTLEQVAGTLDELVEAVHNGFTSIQQVLATKADKTDLDYVERRLDARIDKTNENISYLRLKVDDIHEELRGFTSDVRDDLSARITVLEKKRA